MKTKLYIVEIDGKNVRSIRTEKNLLIGSFIPDEIWLGNKIQGGIVTKILCKE